jgi:excisionase family DNA binding protein
MPKNIGRGSVMSARIAIPEIARRLDIGRLAVYSMLEQGLLPGIRIGRRWLVTRNAYEQWERTCGMPQVLSSGTLDFSPSSA